MQRLASLPSALLPGRERAEVLRGLRDDVAVQAHRDATRGDAADADVEEDLRGEGTTRERCRTTTIDRSVVRSFVLFVGEIGGC
jgi:hypothetical protein